MIQEQYAFGENHEEPNSPARGGEPERADQAGQAEGAGRSDCEAQSETSEHPPREGARRLRLTLAYKGTRYQGWQLQAKTLHGKPQRTVQGVLEEAVATICQVPIRAHGASRTDSGVHALGQVCHVDIPPHKQSLDWQLALNGLLPKDVNVLEAAWAPPGFHARFSAGPKRYSYRFWTSRRCIFPQRRPYVWQCDPLDVDAMRTAAAALLGTHDFAAFTNAGSCVDSTVRTLTRLEPLPPCGEAALEQVWVVEASGFLKQMVRNIMGCLREVGRGMLPPEAVQEILAGKDRTKAPCCAPAQGLCLEHIQYDTDSGI